MTRVVLGLTGSIGMGKSTTAAIFADLGVPVWDADAAVHRIYAAGGAGGPALSALVPDAVGPDGAVCRDALRAAIRDEPDLLASIEAIVHPLVARDRAAFLAAHASDDVVLLDIPLLFETGGDRAVDHVVVASTNAAEQRRRVLSRPGMTPDAFENLLGRQLPDAEKRARADTIIPTDDLAGARAAVEQLLRDLRQRGENDA